MVGSIWAARLERNDWNHDADIGSLSLPARRWNHMQKHYFLPILPSLLLTVYHSPWTLAPLSTYLHCYIYPVFPCNPVTGSQRFPPFLPYSTEYILARAQAVRRIQKPCPPTSCIQKLFKHIFQKVFKTYLNKCSSCN